PYAKVFPLEFQFREPVIPQQPDQFAQLVHVDGSFSGGFVLFFACSHVLSARPRTGRLLFSFLSGIRGLALGCFLRSLPLRSRSFCPFLGGFERLDFARIADQLDNRELSIVAVTMAQFKNAGITAGTILVALSEFVEETSQGRNAGSATRF